MRINDQGIELEADPRHIEIATRELELQTARASTVPGAKEGKRKERVEGGVDSVVKAKSSMNG